MTATQAQDEDIARIMALAQARRLDEAALAAREAQARGARGAVFAALAGAVEFHRRNFAAAVPYLQSAHAERPDDNVVRGNLAESLFRTGHGGAALALCTLAAAQADPSRRLARLGAHLAQEAEDFAQAIPLYRLVVAAEPADWASWNNLGNALTAEGDHDEAVRALGRAAQLAPDVAPIRLNLGRAQMEVGDLAGAEAQFRTMIRDFPQDAQAHYSLFALLRDAGHAEDALATLRQAAELAPQDAEIQADLGQYLAEIGAFAQAEGPLRAAIAADPQVVRAWVGLASLLERLNREEELDPLRERAAGHAIDPRPLAFIDALRFKRSHDYAAALAALEDAGEDLVTPGQRLHLRGVLLDRLARPDEAFAAFAAMNAELARHPSDPRARGAAYRAEVAAGTALLTPAWRAGWRAFTPSLARPSPIFLLGFPRSGTTLLDTMLLAEPRVKVLEEENLIADLEAELGGLAALPDLTAPQIEAARARYFERAAALGAPDVDSIILDKHPMHLRHAPTIARLFPESRFILALRHPCDVLLSCWLTNFRLNNAMASFLDLDDAADLYDAAFAQWTQARAVLGLDVGTVVYERLVEGAEAELRPLFDWLGLDWPDQGLDHREAARARGTVTTASYAQVTEPVYKRAAGRWRKYATHLAGVEAQLAPWIARFGYADGAVPPRPAGHPVEDAPC